MCLIVLLFMVDLGMYMVGCVMMLRREDVCLHALYSSYMFCFYVGMYIVGCAMIHTHTYSQPIFP